MKIHVLLCHSNKCDRSSVYPLSTRRDSYRCSSDSPPVKNRGDIRILTVTCFTTIYHILVYLYRNDRFRITGKTKITYQ